MQVHATNLAAKEDFLSLYPKFKEDTLALLASCDSALSSKPVDEQNFELAKAFLTSGIFTEADCYPEDDGTPSVTH